MIPNPSARSPGYFILIVFVGISALIATGGYFYYTYSKNILREERFSDLKAIADLKEAQILQWSEERLADARTVTNNPFIRRHLNDIFSATPDSFTSVMIDYLNNTRKEFGFQDIFIASTTGEILFSTDQENNPPEEVVKRNNELCHLQRSVHFSGFDLDNKNLPYLNLVAPFYKDTSYLGYVLFRVDPQLYLFPLIQLWPTPNRSSETLIFLASGDSVVFLNELRHWPNSSLSLKIPLARKDIAAVMAVDGTRGFVEANDYRGHPVIAYLKSIEGTDWFMVAKTDQDEIFQPMKQEAIVISSAIILLLIIFGIISYLIFKQYLTSFFVRQVNEELGLRSYDDIEQRKKYELQIQKLNRLYSTLISINQSMVRMGDKEWMLKELCTILIDKGNYRMVSVGEFTAGRFEVLSCAGHEDGYYNVVRITSENSPSGNGPTGTAFSTQKFVVCQDIDTDPTMKPWREEALKRGYHSSAAFPIMYNEETIGILNIFASEVEWFDTEEIFLLEQLSNDIGYALGVFFMEQKSREIKHELQASENKFQQVFNAMNDGVATHEIVFDPSGTPVDYRILDVNPMFEVITSIPAQKAVGALATELYQISPAPYSDIYLKVARSGCSDVFEAFFPPMGKHFRISVFSQMQNGFTTVFQDITDQVEARNYLKRMNQELEKRVTERTALLEIANRELESFAYSVSHDLKAPLRSISGFASILETRYSNSLDEEGLHFLQNIIQAGKNMHQLIEDLLRYAKLGRMKPEFTSVDLKHLVESCISDMKSLIEPTGAELSIPSETIFVKGNSTMLIQIFNNLIINSLTYQNPGNKPRIDITWVPEGDAVVIQIKDNGIGIEEKFYDKVFKIFQRLHKEDQFQGTGIGLAIVKKAVEIHEGHVWISESTPGAGSTFSIKLFKSDTL